MRFKPKKILRHTSGIVQKTGFRGSMFRPRIFGSFRAQGTRYLAIFRGSGGGFWLPKNSSRGMGEVMGVLV